MMDVGVLCGVRPGIFGAIQNPSLVIAEVALVDVPHWWADQLHSTENIAIVRAVPRRRVEFVAGRVLAHRLMRQLEFPVQAVEKGEAGAPRWPEGLLGSITHSDDRCAVALGKAGELSAVGIDLESVDPIEPAYWNAICTEPELARLEATMGWMPLGTRVRLAFACKEAFYKAWWPRTGCFLEHHDLEIEMAETNGTFKVNLREGLARTGASSGLGTFHLSSGQLGAAWIDFRPARDY